MGVDIETSDHLTLDGVIGRKDEGRFDELHMRMFTDAFLDFLESCELEYCGGIGFSVPDKAKRISSNVKE